MDACIIRMYKLMPTFDFHCVYEFDIYRRYKGDTSKPTRMTSAYKCFV